MPQAACPFCFRRVDTSRLAYQCSNRGLKECTLAEDEKRKALTLSNALSYRTFDAPPGKAEPICPDCGSVATRRACPQCHTAVPIDFVDSDSPMIGIVGSKGSGKTVLMTVLTKQLREVVGKRFGAAVRMATDNPDGAQGVDAYKATREAALYEGRSLPAGTNQNAATRRSPLVLVWQGMQTRKLGGSRRTSTILSFVDTAGEDLTDLDTTFTLRYLTVCDGLIVALDPFALPGARSRLNLPRAAVQSQDGVPLEVVERITEVLRNELRVKKKGKIKLPVAVVFTKIDAFFDVMDRGNPIMSAPSKAPAYPKVEGEAVHEHVRALLHEWDAGDIDIHMQLNYADFRFFAVSALGAEPDYAAQSVAPGGVRPHRVEDPILWLLAKEGTVASA
jgi:ABC-type dipeptide/oligopeptide/nickel transport system ATPase component